MIRKCNSKPWFPQKYIPISAITVENPLLAQLSLVESKLLSLQDVSVTTSTLSRSRGDNGKKTTGLELLLQSRLDLSLSSETVVVLLLDRLALLGIRLNNLLTSLLLASAAQVLSIVCLIPLSERSGINLHDSGSGESVGSDQLVVGGVESDDDHTDLAGNALRSP